MQTTFTPQFPTFLLMKFQHLNLKDMQKIKHMLRGRYKPLGQIYWKETVWDVFSKDKKTHKSVFINHQNTFQDLFSHCVQIPIIQNLFFNFFVLTTTLNNQYCGSLNNDVIQVVHNFAFLNTTNEMVVIWKTFFKLLDFHRAPVLQSSQMGFYKTSKYSEWKF